MSDEHDTDAGDLTDELAKKYDPERLLKIIGKRAGRGDPLEHSVRQRYEKRFGLDLGHVRVFSGEFAEQFNKQRSSYAVTVGSTGMILMGNSPDKSMGSAAGQALLAHELTHVAQKSGGLHAKARHDLPFAHEDELEADAVEGEVHSLELGAGAKQDSAENEKTRRFKIAGHRTMQEAIERIHQRAIDILTEHVRNQGLRGGGGR